MKKIVFFFLFASFLLADDFKYVVDVNGTPRGSGCAAEGIRLAKIFSDQTGLTFNAKNNYESWRGCAIDLSYTSSAPREIFQTEEYPVYASYDACLANLDEEQKQFETLTGLKPFYRFCSTAYYDNHPKGGWVYRYSARFYAKGIPAVFPKVIKMETMDGDFLGDSATVGEIMTRSKEAKLPITRAFIDGRGFGGGVWIELAVPLQKLFKMNFDYSLKSYLESWPDFDFEGRGTPTKLYSSQECAWQLERAKEMTKDYFSAVWFCMGDPNGLWTTLYHLRIKPGPESLTRVKPGSDGQPFQNYYDTLAQCEADKPKVVEHYQKLFPERVLGVLCSFPSYSSVPRKPYQHSLYLKQEL